LAIKPSTTVTGFLGTTAPLPPPPNVGQLCAAPPITASEPVALKDAESSGSKLPLFWSNVADAADSFLA
jgi:hypothetical protein